MSKLFFLINLFYKIFTPGMILVVCDNVVVQIQIRPKLTALEILSLFIVKVKYNLHLLTLADADLEMC